MSKKEIKEILEIVGFIRDHAATKSDVQELREDIEDIRARFATKDDLKGFATKDDLKGFATKDDLKGFATRDNLKETENRIVTYIDGLVKGYEVLRAEDAALHAKIDRVESDLRGEMQQLKLQSSSS
jgi:hypothetical protein